MTLIIGVISKEGIVIASDGRATSFLTSNDNVRKIFQLGDCNALGIAGDGTLVPHFLHKIKPKLNFNIDIADIAEQFREQGKDRFNDIFSHLQPKERPELEIILAGYTPTGDGKLYVLNSADNFVPRESPTGFTCIGIPVIADYLLNRLYEPQIALTNAAELAVFCIKETISQDHRVGGEIQVVTFSNTAKFALFSKTQIENMGQKQEILRLGHKSLFYPEEEEGKDTSTDATKVK